MLGELDGLGFYGGLIDDVESVHILRLPENTYVIISYRHLPTIRRYSPEETLLLLLRHSISKLHLREGLVTPLFQALGGFYPPGLQPIMRSVEVQALNLRLQGP